MSHLRAIYAACGLALGLAVVAGACGSDAEVRQYPDADSAQERGTSGGESEQVERSQPPPSSGGHHPTDDEVTGEEIHPL